MKVCIKLTLNASHKIYIQGQTNGHEIKANQELSSRGKADEDA